MSLPHCCKYKKSLISQHLEHCQHNSFHHWSTQPLPIQPEVLMSFLVSARTAGKRTLTFLRIEENLGRGFSGGVQHSRISGSLSIKYLQYDRNRVDTPCNFVTASDEKETSSKFCSLPLLPA